MSVPVLFRLSGLALVIGTLLGLAGELLHPRTHDLVDQLSWNWVPAHTLFFSAMIFMLLGVTGVYLRQAQRAGIVGFVGFAMMFVGMSVVGAGFMMLEAFVLPVLLENEATQYLASEQGPIFNGPLMTVMMIFGGPMYQLGTIITGATIFRAGVFPRWAGPLLVAGVIFGFFSDSLGEAGRYLGTATMWPALIWLGLTLVRAPLAQARRSAPSEELTLERWRTQPAN
jgi:hypothetical protein